MFFLLVIIPLLGQEVVRQLSRENPRIMKIRGCNKPELFFNPVFCFHISIKQTFHLQPLNQFDLLILFVLSSKSDCFFFKLKHLFIYVIKSNQIKWHQVCGCDSVFVKMCLFESVFSEQGVRGLYRGFGSTVLREVGLIPLICSLSFTHSYLFVCHSLLTVITINNTCSKADHTCHVCVRLSLVSVNRVGHLILPLKSTSRLYSKDTYLTLWRLYSEFFLVG